MRMALGGQGTFVALNGTANQITVTPNTSDMTLSIPSNAILPGAVPVGSIIAIGDAGAWALPASGAIKDGYALCNGQVKPVGSAAGLAANLPNLTDDRFLNGSTALSGNGGANSKTTTGANARIQKDQLNTGQILHNHGMSHKHRWSYTTAGTEYLRSWDSNLTDTIIGGDGTVSTGFGTTAFNMINYKDWYTETPLVSTAGTTSKNDTDAIAVNWTTYNISQPLTYVDLIMTQGTISDIRPNYFNVVYVMRVA
jgi:hypothetical protein